MVQSVWSITNKNTSAKQNASSYDGVARLKSKQFILGEKMNLIQFSRQDLLTSGTSKLPPIVSTNVPSKHYVPRSKIKLKTIDERTNKVAIQKDKGTPISKGSDETEDLMKVDSLRNVGTDRRYNKRFGVHDPNQHEDSISEKTWTTSQKINKKFGFHDLSQHEDNISEKTWTASQKINKKFGFHDPSQHEDNFSEKTWTAPQKINKKFGFHDPCQHEDNFSEKTLTAPQKINKKLLDISRSKMNLKKQGMQKIAKKNLLTSIPLINKDSLLSVGSSEDDCITSYQTNKKTFTHKPMQDKDISVDSNEDLHKNDAVQMDSSKPIGIESKLSSKHDLEFSIDTSNKDLASSKSSKFANQDSHLNSVGLPLDGTLPPDVLEQAYIGTEVDESLDDALRKDGMISSHGVSDQHKDRFSVASSDKKMQNLESDQLSPTDDKFPSQFASMINKNKANDQQSIPGKSQMTSNYQSKNFFKNPILDSGYFIPNEFQVDDITLEERSDFTVSDKVHPTQTQKPSDLQSDHSSILKHMQAGSLSTLGQDFILAENKSKYHEEPADKDSLDRAKRLTRQKDLKSRKRIAKSRKGKKNIVLSSIGGQRKSSSAKKSKVDAIEFHFTNEYEIKKLSSAHAGFSLDDKNVEKSYDVQIDSGKLTESELAVDEIGSSKVKGYESSADERSAFSGSRPDSSILESNINYIQKLQGSPSKITTYLSPRALPLERTLRKPIITDATRLNKKILNLRKEQDIVKEKEKNDKILRLLQSAKDLNEAEDIMNAKIPKLSFQGKPLREDECIYEFISELNKLMGQIDFTDDKQLQSIHVFNLMASHLNPIETVALKAILQINPKLSISTRVEMVIENNKYVKCLRKTFEHLTRIVRTLQIHRKQFDDDASRNRYTEILKSDLVDVLSKNFTLHENNFVPKALIELRKTSDGILIYTDAFNILQNKDVTSKSLDPRETEEIIEYQEIDQSDYNIKDFEGRKYIVRVQLMDKIPTQRMWERELRRTVLLNRSIPDIPIVMGLVEKYYKEDHDFSDFDNYIAEHLSKERAYKKQKLFEDMWAYRNQLLLEKFDVTGVLEAKTDNEVAFEKI